MHFFRNQMQAEASSETGWNPNVGRSSPNCPRCGSPNTKFCYYNNYSSTQPRYFCKGCRRYWTKGGSLRNVPVGGGCRKSRRGNKTLRQSIKGVVVEHSGGLRRTSSSNSSVVLSDASNIDLAQVYANFLNQKPDSTADLEKPDDQMKTALDPTLEYSILSNIDVGPSTLLPEEFGLSGCLHFYEQPTESVISEGSVQMYLCGGFNSVQSHQECRIDQISNHDTTNFELPPLPDEEAASHDMLLSDTEMMINHALQATQMPLSGPEAHDADLLMGRWSPFDFPRDALFSSP